MTDARLLAEDAAARERALAPESFIVEAPAGAGKTELLTQRYLRLLAGVGDPEEIVAITFTNKAAAEMRGRILDSLDTARRGVPPEAAHKRITYDLSRAVLAVSAERGWALEANPGRLRILTIDALCTSLARQMPVLSRFGAQPAVVDDARRHYEEAARRTLALLDDMEDGQESAAVADALRHLDNDAPALARLLAAMLARRDQWLRHALAEDAGVASERGLRQLLARDLAAAAQAVDARLQARLMPLARYAAANLHAAAPQAALLDWTVPLVADAAQLPLWRGVCELLLTKEGELRKVVDKRSGFPAGKEGKAQKDAMTALLDELAGADFAALARVRTLPEPNYTEEEKRTVAALARLLQLAAAQLWTVFHEAGEADFIEVAQRALAALGDVEAPSDLALRLDYRLQHLLVDEFQDTSPTQIELLRRLTAGWTPGDGRTLFCVGDPMQSIYRFRKADVGLFLGAAHAGIGGLPLESLRLTRNNRSCAPVVEWINTAFARVFPAADSVTAGAIAYREFVATRADLPQAGVQVHALVADAESDDEVREARQVLAAIDAERAADPQREIAVLVRARRHLTALVAEIRRHRPELRFRAVEIEALAERQPVQDILALTRALLHRADRVNWLAVLRAPWCGLTLADLHALAADDHRATVWSLINDAERMARLSDDGHARLAHVRGVLGAALAQRGRQPLARWIAGTWLALGGAGCLANTADIADAEACLDLIARLDAAGRFRLDRIEAELADLYAAPDAAADGQLQFMTIHKSKGLEFDTVIVPGLHRLGANDSSPLMRWEEVIVEDIDEAEENTPGRPKCFPAPWGENAAQRHFRGGLIAAPMRRRGQRKTDLPTPYDYLGGLERERADNETARVLYVAATRAVRSLHWVGVARRNAAGEAAAPANTFLSLLWDTIGGEFARAAAAAGAAPSGEPELHTPFVPKLIRAVAPAVPEVLRATPPRREAYADAPGEAEDEAAADALDASVGTLVHACLESIAREGVDAWPVERVATLAPALRRWLTRRGYGAADAAEGARRAQEALAATLASDNGRWLLAAHEDAAAELALVGRSGEAVATRIVDRCFVADDTRWIVDYKTARVEGDAAGLAAHAERYRAQLEGYAALFVAEGRSIRLAIFYAASGRLVELPPRQSAAIA